jgi:hypothetical protein
MSKSTKPGTRGPKPTQINPEDVRKYYGLDAGDLAELNTDAEMADAYEGKRNALEEQYRQKLATLTSEMAQAIGTARTKRLVADAGAALEALPPNDNDDLLDRIPSAPPSDAILKGKPGRPTDKDFYRDILLAIQDAPKGQKNAYLQVVFERHGKDPSADNLKTYTKRAKDWHKKDREGWIANIQNLLNQGKLGGQN